MSQGPETWKGTEESLSLGQALVQEFVPFARQIAESTPAPVTIRRHMDNLWTLGAAIIKNADLYDECDPSNAAELLEKAILGGKGSLIDSSFSHDDAEQKAFEQTTRKLAKFQGMDAW